MKYAEIVVEFNSLKTSELDDGERSAAHHGRRSSGTS
jgi:hypothetical protein